MALTVVTPATNSKLTQVQTVKDELGIAAADTSFDTLIGKKIDRASASINTFCNRVFAKQTYRETLAGRGHPVLVLAMPPLISISSAKFQSNVIALSDFTIEDKWAALLHRRANWDWTTHSHSPFESLESYPVAGGEDPDYEFDYVAGFVMPGDTPGAGDIPLPADVEEAAVEAVKDWFIRRASSSNIESKSVGDLSITYRREFASEAGIMEAEHLPPKSRALLRRWERLMGAQA